MTNDLDNFTATKASSLATTYLQAAEGEAHEVLLQVLRKIKTAAETTGAKSITIAASITGRHTAAVKSALSSRGFRVTERGEQRDGYYLDITW